MSELSKQALQVENTTSFPNNTTGYITPTLLRSFNSNVIDSTVNQTGYTSNSGSWNISISNLNAFTASQQPSFNALNAFTASQLTINSGINLFTQSANSSISQLNTYTSSFTTSVGIYDEATFVQNVNQIAFSGNGISASYVSGKAVVGVDFTPLNSFTASQAVTNTNLNSFTSSANVSITNLNIATASFNAYTSSITSSIGALNQFTKSAGTSIDNLNSTTASLLIETNNLEIFTASANVSITNLNSTTASLVTSVSSLNSFTTSVNSKTGSFATTGSNAFFGNQTISGSTTINGSATITGSITITGSAYGNVISASIASSTASIDLSKGNFFTLALPNGVTTNINVTNAQPGTTALIRITNTGITSASFSNNVKQPQYNAYLPSTGSSTDLLSLQSFDSSTVYLTKATNFI
jgi:hypothetical protein